MPLSNLRYNLFMKFGRISHSLASTIHLVLRWATDSHTAEDQSSPLERPLAEGSEMIGDHNFRTGRPDSGNDPIGWYEEDF